MARSATPARPPTYVVAKYIAPLASLNLTYTPPLAPHPAQRIFSEWARCFGPESDFYTHDDPASVLGVSPEAIRARLDAQTQELERLRAEVVELRRKTGR